MRGTTTYDDEHVPVIDYISIHVPRERDDEIRELGEWSEKISIHVPRERDDSEGPARHSIALISIHVPRERDDEMPPDCLRPS